MALLFLQLKWIIRFNVWSFEKIFVYLKVEDQKQSGALEAKTELSLEVQLQAERDAIDRKEKEVRGIL